MGFSSESGREAGKKSKRGKGKYVGEIREKTPPVKKGSVGGPTWTRTNLLTY